MFLFEGFVYLFGIVSLILFIRVEKIGAKQMSYLLLFLFILVLLHFVFEPYRWYLLGLYVSLGLTVVMGYFHVKKYSLVKLGSLITISLYVLSFLLLLAFPIKSFPKTEYPIMIGTESIVITDPSRTEQYDQSNDYRSFKIQYWYPTENIENLEKAKWLYEGNLVSKGLAEDNYLPLFVMNHLTVIESNSYIGATLKNEATPYPVIIISHGWRGFRNLHTDIAEELASNGYFVVAVEHTYGSVATIIDGELKYNYDDALTGEYGEAEYKESSNQLVTTYAEDVIATIDYLEQHNVTDFNNQLDLTKIGLIGHSTGGGADVTVSLRDARVTSIFGLDSWVEPINSSLIESNLDIPAVFLRSDQWEQGSNNEKLYHLINNTTSSASLYQIDGSTHIDFTMTYMMSSLTKLIGFTGELDGDYINQIMESMMLDFFDATLKDNREVSINISDFDEVWKVETK